MNEIKYTEDQIKMIVNMGALGYDKAQISILMGFDVEYVDAMMCNKKSVFCKNYTLGVTKANYLIDLKLFDMAQSGDLKAIEKYEQRKLTNKYK